MNYLKAMLELKKYNRNQLLLVVSGSAIIPFAIGMFIIFTQSNAMQNVPVELISPNLSGPWTAILMGILTILITQIAMEVEKTPNLLPLYRVYKGNWYFWILKKTTFVWVTLLIIIIINTILTTLLIYIISVSRLEEDIFSFLLQSHVSTMAIATIFALPGISFHIFLNCLFNKTSSASIIGLLLLIGGLPIANLTNLYLIPYNFTIFSQKPSVNLFTLGIVSTLIIFICFYLSNYILKSTKLF